MTLRRNATAKKRAIFVPVIFNANMNKDRFIDRRERERRGRNTEATTDMFVALCRSQLQMECVKEFRFHPVRRWRFDYAFPKFKVALEVEGGVWTGGRHVSPKGFLGDMEKYNTAAVMGWRVLRTVPGCLCGRNTLDMVRRAAGQETK